MDRSSTDDGAKGVNKRRRTGEDHQIYQNINRPTNQRRTHGSSAVAGDQNGQAIGKPNSRLLRGSGDSYDEFLSLSLSSGQSHHSSVPPLMMRRLNEEEAYDHELPFLSLNLAQTHPSQVPLMTHSSPPRNHPQSLPPSVLMTSQPPLMTLSPAMNTQSPLSLSPPLTFNLFPPPPLQPQSADFFFPPQSAEPHRSFLVQPPEPVITPATVTPTRGSNQIGVGGEQRRNITTQMKPGKSSTVPPPYPWATNHRASIHSLNYLESNQITTITGDVQCKHCDKIYQISYDLHEKFSEVEKFVKENKVNMRERAPGPWMNPVLPRCRFCNRDKAVKPVIGERKREINWLFMLLGQTLGCCTLEQLKYFCKHSNNHRTGAKDRVLYLTYLSLCKQLKPCELFDR